MADQWNSNIVEEGESYEMVSRSSTKMKIRRVKNKKTEGGHSGGGGRGKGGEEAN